jgi:phosphoglycolate phosphatase
MKKLVIFDLDGTLLDTIGDLAAAANHALQEYGFQQHPEQDYRFFVGNGINKLIERSLPVNQRSADTISMVKHEFMKYYQAHGEESTRPYPGTRELLSELNGMGIQLAVASNKFHEGTVELVRHFFPEIPFVSVLGQREGVPVKPSPVIVEQIRAVAGATQDETLYVGDSGVDAATALNAGVDFIGVLWGFRPQSELEEAGATQFVSEAGEVKIMIND